MWVMKYKVYLKNTHFIYKKILSSLNNLAKKISLLVEYGMNG